MPEGEDDVRQDTWSYGVLPLGIVSVSFFVVKTKSESLVCTEIIIVEVAW